MKTFQRHVTHAELVMACHAHGIRIDSKLYEEWTTDFVRVFFEHASLPEKPTIVYYSPINGRFFGWLHHATEEGHFDNARADLDGTDWYEALMTLLYTDAPLPNVQQPAERQVG